MYAGTAARVTAILDRYMARGMTTLVCLLGRRHLLLAQLQEVAEHEVRDVVALPDQRRTSLPPGS